MNKLFSKHFTLMAVLILFAALTRILPHYPNFTAVGAMALFGAAHLKHKWQAFLIPLGAMYLSDLFINNIIYAEFYNGFVWKISPFVYLAFLLILGIGYLLRDRVNVKNVIAASLSSSVIFFLLTNAVSWQVDPIYTKDFAGLMTAYAGIPYFWSTLAGDLFYCGVLFGGYAWFTQRYPQWGVALG